MTDNLYQPPSAPISARGFSGDAGVSPLAIQHLVRTQPWVRLISVAGIIMTCLILVLLLFFPVALGVAYPRAGGAAAVAIVLPAAIVGLLYLYPLLKLSKYAAAIRRLQLSHSGADLEDALDQQRSFWKFIGVLMLIGIIFWGFGIMIALLSPTSPTYPPRM